jgi:hypothetical protein
VTREELASYNALVAEVFGLRAAMANPTATAIHWRERAEAAESSAARLREALRGLLGPVDELIREAQKEDDSNRIIVSRRADDAEEAAAIARAALSEAAPLPEACYHAFPMCEHERLAAPEGRKP